MAIAHRVRARRNVATDTVSVRAVAVARHASPRLKVTPRTSANVAKRRTEPIAARDRRMPGIRALLSPAREQ